MDKLNQGKMMLYLLMAILAAIACLSFTYWSRLRSSKVNYQQNFNYSKQTIPNPLMGFAPRADSGYLSHDINLVYIDVFWSELEPKEGQYDWQAIEHKYQFESWRLQGKHAILRFVMDYPGQEAHRDIPDWLYRKTKDGTAYSNSYGKGYSPNYKNKKLIKAYEKAVKAMSDRWGQDSFVSYIELGGLGHWGEWHTDLAKGKEGAIPDEDTRDLYVEPWLDRFPHAELLMRRPFTIAKDEELGLFNDVFGNTQATDAWLKWIQKGGSYDQTGEKNAMSAMPDFWKKAPSGGEIASTINMENLLSHDLEDTVNYLKESHTTFLGPKTADRSLNSDGYDSMLKNMGYRLWISEAKILDNRKLSITWENSGVAPFYWDWPVKVYVDTGVNHVSLDTAFKTSSIMPGQSQTMTVTLNKELSEKWQGISIAIQDPMTDQDAVHLAMEGLETQTRIPLLKK